MALGKSTTNNSPLENSPLAIHCKKIHYHDKFTSRNFHHQKFTATKVNISNRYHPMECDDRRIYQKKSICLKGGMTIKTRKIRLSSQDVGSYTRNWLFFIIIEKCLLQIKNADKTAKGKLFTRPTTTA